MLLYTSNTICRTRALVFKHFCSSNTNQFSPVTFFEHVIVHLSYTIERTGPICLFGRNPRLINVDKLCCIARVGNNIVFCIIGIGCVRRYVSWIILKNEFDIH